MAKKKRRGRGEGSLYQREDGLWVGSIVVGYNPETGNARRKVVYGNTKEEARKKLLDLQQKSLAGQLGASTMTLKSCLEFWLDVVVRVKVDPGTYALHRQRVKDYILPYLGHVRLAGLTPFMVAQWYQDLEKEGRSADLRNKVGQLLRRCLKHAVGFGLLHDNVAMKLPLPKVDVEEMRPLDEGQVKRFLTVAVKNRLYPLYLLAIDSGMRQGEIIALEWTDIDFESGIVSITKSARGGEKGGVRIKEVKTKASRRRIKLARRTLEALAALRQKSKGRLVFPNRKGKHLLKSNLRVSFKRLLRKAELPEIRFHDLRHTHATLALLRTKNIKAVSARLGHADIRVTLETYAHFLPVMEDELVAAMEDLLTPQPPQETPKPPEPAAPAA
ncbi:MAG: site-specific integrase [Gemmataceae bacterium]|nr:site-specific integrase [Gemmataceae bacterium]